MGPPFTPFFHVHFRQALYFSSSNCRKSWFCYWLLQAVWEQNLTLIQLWMQMQCWSSVISQSDFSLHLVWTNQTISSLRQNGNTFRKWSCFALQGHEKSQPCKNTTQLSIFLWSNKLKARSSLPGATFEELQHPGISSNLSPKLSNKWLWSCPLEQNIPRLIHLLHGRFSYPGKQLSCFSLIFSSHDYR